MNKPLLILIHYDADFDNGNLLLAVFTAEGEETIFPTSKCYGRELRMQSGAYPARFRRVSGISSSRLS